MKKKRLVFLTIATLALGMLGGCQREEKSDREAADKVADMIDAIYVQTRTDETDEQCEAAKEAWDALTDEQKELVEGENASPDYYGLDTGDATRDDTLNEDGIGENEILVVSFGTSYNDSRFEDIGGIEKAIIKEFPEWSVRRAFTSQIIINHVQSRDGAKIDNVSQALERAVNNGVKNLVVQPTHLMHGAEYDELMDSLEEYKDKFESVVVAEPLLGELDSDSNTINEDKRMVAEAVVSETVEESKYDSLEAAKEDKLALVLLGHGTSHTAKVSYNQMATQFDKLGYDNVFVGTVEGEPEDTSCESVIEQLKNAGYQKVILRPLMVVAGDHANNDMAGEDDDSWRSAFEAAGFEVECQIKGLGSIEEIQAIYVDHTATAMDDLGKAGTDSEETAEQSDETLADGTYSVDFVTDSSMFHVNEACEGKGELTVKDGRMMVHISLTSKNILNLYVGLAEDAKKDDANLLYPTVDEVTYSDGTTEEVNGFDVPVERIGEEFDLALIGTKGKWYDHKVSVSNPEKK